MSGDREIELKFLCAPEETGAVLAAAPQGEENERELLSVYFDTPARDLSKAGVSLRVRQAGRQRVQTFKRGDGFAREEYESPVESDEPDLTRHPFDGLLPEEARSELRPAFYVRVRRRQRLVRVGGAEIELAVDRGDVADARRSKPICEVELELKSGPPAALFELARQLARAAPLYLSFDGKSSQGSALIAGKTLEPRKAARPKLKRWTTTSEAFQIIARAALSQIAANGVVLREADSVEALHQLRVAVRRLRSAVAAFKNVVDDEAAEDIVMELKWLAGACDEARDLDVFAEDAAKFDADGLDLAALAPVVEAARARA
ncbi:MAG TPA: inorganic triphosphatase, partial [Phenylobacterium sp.]